jgi:predicted esterase
MIGLTSLLLLLAACGTSPAAPTSTPLPPTPTPTATRSATPLPITVTRDVVYMKPLQPAVVQQRLDVYAPGEPGAWPVVVFAHGLGEDKEDRAELSHAIAGQGAVVFTLDWPAVSPSQPVQFREMEEALACAVRFARARASDYGGDPARVTLVGFSVGGGVGSRVALVGDELDRLWEEYAANRGGPPPQVGCVSSAASAQVDAFVGIGGAYGLPGRLRETAPELGDVLGRRGENSDLKIRLIHGERDTMVPFEAAVAFDAALTAAGYDTKLIPFEGGHTVPTQLTTAVIMEVSELRR